MPSLLPPFRPPLPRPPAEIRAELQSQPENGNRGASGEDDADTDQAEDVDVRHGVHPHREPF